MRSFDAVLFDLDGLLVDTEKLHWQAYREMCQEFGFVMDWDFPLYIQIAGGSAEGIRDRLKKEFPNLFEGRTWEQLYEVKRQKLSNILSKANIPLMPGVEKIISFFDEQQIPMCVVTHSPRQFVELIKKAHPLFQKISWWVVREMYDAPKPAPDGYLMGCRLAGVFPNKAIGFEDTIRGLEALVQAGVRAVLINAQEPSAHAYCKERKIEAYRSFDEVLKNHL